MKPITIKNEYGESIEIKFNTDGVIKIGISRNFAARRVEAFR